MIGRLVLVCSLCLLWVTQVDAGVLRLRRQCRGPSCPVDAVATVTVESPAIVAADRDVGARNPRVAEFRRQSEVKAQALKAQGKSEREIRRTLLRDASASGLPWMTIIELILDILQKLFPR